MNKHSYTLYDRHNSVILLCACVVLGNNDIMAPDKINEGKRKREEQEGRRWVNMRVWHKKGVGRTGYIHLKLTFKMLKEYLCMFRCRVISVEVMATSKSSSTEIT